MPLRSNAVDPIGIAASAKDLGIAFRLTGGKNVPTLQVMSRRRNEISAEGIAAIASIIGVALLSAGWRNRGFNKRMPLWRHKIGSPRGIAAFANVEDIAFAVTRCLNDRICIFGMCARRLLCGTSDQNHHAKAQKKNQRQ